MTHQLYVVAVADVAPVPELGPHLGKLADLVCSCGRTYRVRDAGTVRPGMITSRPRCLDATNLSNAIAAIQRTDVNATQPTMITLLGARDVDGEPLLPGDFVEAVDRRLVGYVDRYNGPNIMRIETAIVLLPRTHEVEVIAGSGRYWRKLEDHDSRIDAAYTLLRRANVQTQAQLRQPEIAPLTISHWWIRWTQPLLQGLRPWPPPPQVLAYWIKGSGEATALCQASSPREVRQLIQQQWGPSTSPELFVVPYPLGAGPPGDEFPPPAWSLKLQRWPWPTEA